MGDVRDHYYRLGDWGVDLRYTPLVRDVLAKRKIFINGATPESAVRFGRDTLLEPYVYLYTPLCGMGSFSYAQGPLPEEMKVGRYCSIGPGLRVFGMQHPYSWASTSSVTFDNGIYNLGPDRFEGPLFRAIETDFYRGAFTYGHIPAPPYPKIENDVWVGQDAQMAKNITIKTGAVVGAGAVVTKDVPPYMIVGGVPARVIRPRFPEKIIERLLASEWWTFDVRVLQHCDYKNPEKFVDDFEAMKATRKLEPYRPATIGFRDIINDLIDSA